MNPKKAISDRQGDKRDIQVDQPVRFWDLRSSVSVGFIILGLLQISTNGVYNHFSDVPGFQLYPFFVFLSAGIWYLAFHIAIHLKNVPWIFMGASIVCCLGFVMVTQQVDRKIATNNSAEGISIEPGAALVPEDPFQSSFIIRNQSPSIAIHDLHYSWWFIDPDSRAKYFIIGFYNTNGIDEIGPSGYADLKLWDPGHGYPKHLGNNTSFHLEVSYIRSNREFTNRFLFVIRNRPDGRFQWYRRGVSPPMQDVAKALFAKAMQSHYPLDYIPFITIHVNSFREVSQEDGKSCPELVYTATNSGAFPAKDIQYDWEFFDRTGVSLSKMHVNQTFEDGEDAMYPGGEMTDTILMTGMSHEFYSAIANGNIAMAGEISFNPTIDSTNFWWTFKIVHQMTNDYWETRGLDFSPSLHAAGFQDAN
jgi:hypothetical protein